MLGRIFRFFTESPLAVGLVIVVGVAGPRLYMNLRPPDPLPAGFTQYTPDAFAEAMATDQTILVDVYASWCPTCKVQHLALDTLLREPRFAAVRGFRVDFEDEAAFVKTHRVVTQSTLLIFRGGKEISRSVGLTWADDIQRQLDTALLP
jgi:thiol:disulfide interchange protein